MNPALLDSIHNTPESLFQSELYVARMSNNSRELIGKRQQGRVLSAVRGELYSIVRSSDSDSSGLGR